jgi:hypothetical protein
MFEGLRVGRRFRGIGGVLLESRFEIGEALLVVLNQSRDGGLSSQWDLLPEFLRD